jgi:hypothetical protein
MWRKGERKKIFVACRRNRLKTPDSRKEMEGKGSKWKGFFCGDCVRVARDGASEASL